MINNETWVWSLGWEDPLEAGLATHSSIFAWKNPKDRGIVGSPVTKSQTWLKQLSKHTNIVTLKLKG